MNGLLELFLYKTLMEIVGISTRFSLSSSVSVLIFASVRESAEKI